MKKKLQHELKHFIKPETLIAITTIPWSDSASLTSTTVVTSAKEVMFFCLCVFDCQRVNKVEIYIPIMQKLLKI